MQCKKSQTIHDWIEWICMELRPFSFVESEYVKKNVKLEAISKNTLQKYMHLLTKKVEQEIIKAMPEKKQRRTHSKSEHFNGKVEGTEDCHRAEKFHEFKTSAVLCHAMVECYANAKALH